MATSEAQRKATEKYLKESVDEIKVRVPRGKRAEIKAIADMRGKSLNGYIVDAITEKMERDGDA